MVYPEKVISSFMKHAKTSDIARETGLSVKTIQKYKRDPELQKILRERQDELVSEALGVMKFYLKDSAKVLVSIIFDKTAPAQTRVNAIQVLMKQCSEWMDRNEFLDRLQAIEKTLMAESSDFAPSK